MSQEKEMSVLHREIEQVVGHIIEEEWFDFIDYYREKYGIILNELNRGEVFDAALEVDEHVFGKAIRIAKWLNELE